MLTIPNRIDCADVELVIYGKYGDKPIEGIKNLRRDEYYELLKKKVTAWVREMQRQVYKTEHLFYIEVSK